MRDGERTGEVSVYPFQDSGATAKTFGTYPEISIV